MEKKNGVVETYYDNGQLRTRENYKNDKREGLREVWHDNGLCMVSKCHTITQKLYLITKR